MQQNDVALDIAGEPIQAADINVPINDFLIREARIHSLYNSQILGSPNRLFRIVTTALIAFYTYQLANKLHNMYMFYMSAIVLFARDMLDAVRAKRNITSQALRYNEIYSNLRQAIHLHRILVVVVLLAVITPAISNAESTMTNVVIFCFLVLKLLQPFLIGMNIFFLAWHFRHRPLMIHEYAVLADMIYLRNRHSNVRYHIHHDYTIINWTSALQLNRECSICLTDYVENEQVCKLGCDHCFHQGCISTWLNQNPTCPVCRYNTILNIVYE
jgi:hypothetical protein